MIQVSVRADIDGLRREFGRLGKDIRKAASRALNKTAGNVQVEAAKRIKEERNLKARTIKESLRIKRASPQRLIAEVQATGRPIPLREYGARQGKRGVSVAITKGDRKLIGEQGRRGFLVAKFGGHVFQRKGKERKPIEKKFGPSIPTAFVKDRVLAALRAVIGSAWPKRFAEEARFELTRRR